MKTYILSDEMQVLGSAGEQGGVTVAVDVSDWKTEYPDGIGMLECTRPDGRIEPLEVQLDGDMMKAVLTPACMSRPGEYLYKAAWILAGEMLRSQTYRTLITATEHGRGMPPVRYGTPRWAIDIMEKAEQIITAEDAALQAMVDLQNAAADAGAAQTAAEDAQEAAETAQGKAEDAQEAAEAAQEAAEAVRQGIIDDYIDLAAEVTAIEGGLEYDILLNNKPEDATVNGLKFEWSGPDSCHIYGTATSYSNKLVFMGSATSIPEGTGEGKTIVVSFDADRAVLQVEEYYTDDTSSLSTLDDGDEYTFGENLKGVEFSLFVACGNPRTGIKNPDVDDTVTIHVYGAGSSQHTAEQIRQLMDAADAAPKNIADGIGTGGIIEGNLQDNKSTGDYAHAEGNGTIAYGKAQHVFGEYNKTDGSPFIPYARGGMVEIVGNGTAAQRSNARTLDWYGNEAIGGDLTINNDRGNIMDVGAEIRDMKNTLTGIMTEQQIETDADYYNEMLIGCIRPNGAMLPLDTYKRTPMIRVSEGDELYLWTGTDTKLTAYTIAPFTKQRAVITAGIVQDQQTYTVPEGVAYVMFSVLAADIGDNLYLHFEGTGLAPAKDLTTEGKAADVKAVKDAIDAVEDDIAEVAADVAALDIPARRGTGADSLMTGNAEAASGTDSDAAGNGTIANHRSQHVFGEYNEADASDAAATARGTYAEIVGNGTAIIRSNARTLDWSGNEKLAGSLTLGMGTENEVTITAAQLQQLLTLLQN